jgi:Carbohydrate binding domain
MDNPNRAEVGPLDRSAGSPSSLGTAQGPGLDQERRDRVALPDRGGRHAAPRPDRPRLHVRPLIGLFGLVLFVAAIAIPLVRVINDTQEATGQTDATTAPGDDIPPVATGAFATTGNLLRNWSFEEDTSGWQRVGSARLSRELGGRTSGSSAFVQAAATGPSRVGVAAPEITQVKPGQIYEASAWVRSGTPGMHVTLNLVVNGQGTREATPKTAVTAANPGWVRIDVEHRVKAAGALALEVVLENAKQGEGLLVDEVVVRRT